MRLVDPEVSIIKEKNPLIKIEKAGRLCYKSDSDYTEETAGKFVKLLIEKNHTAMLEHANFVFQVEGEDLYENYYEWFCTFKYLTVTYNSEQTRMLVSGNIRALNEANISLFLNLLKKTYPDLVYVEVEDKYYNWDATIIKDLNNLKELTEEEIKNHSYMSLHFTCDRGITHELVRHRDGSFAQESTRYCNYSKDKFGNEINCILPFWFGDVESPEANKEFKEAMKDAERHYFNLINLGYVAQEARGVLPTALKAEIILTMNYIKWDKFYNLRYFGTTGKPHPQMQEVANMAYKLYKEAQNDC